MKMSNNKHNADLGKEYNGLHPTMILINMALKYGILQGDYSRGYIEVVKKDSVTKEVPIEIHWNF